MKKGLPAFAFLMLAITGGCKLKQDVRPFNAISTDTTIDKHFDIALEYLTKKLPLPSIRKGVDSFEYRFWLSGAEPGLTNLIRIRFEESSWLITETRIWSHIPAYPFNRKDTVNHLLETVIDSVKSAPIVANIDMTTLIDSLQYFNLESASTYKEIRNSFSPHMDGWSHSIELADRQHYRLISYPCPISITGLHNFHKSMKSLFAFLQRSLPINFLPC
ncbi:MAG: hypothetical protein EOO13_18735 [Chitinophagaceae bacterium]|nr:MAG: hypothetical protein EOO13_18735 [Chitinophagaceae bacterium]